MPLDAISIKVVKNGQAGLLRWRILTCSSVIWLGQTSTSSVRPVRTVTESDGSRVGVGPSNKLVLVINNATSPEESLSILGNKSVKLILLLSSVQGNRFHAHGLAVLSSFMLLKVSASKLPCDNKSLSVPEVIGSLGSTLGSSSTNLIARGEGGR